MINAIIVGYGKMGREIENLIDGREIKLAGKYDIDNKLNEQLSGNPDVAIEFTNPDCVIDNISILASKGIHIVCGTTGWYNKTDEVKKIVQENNIGFIYASNFSVGVNIFFNIINNASVIINKFTQYDISIEETHHTQKLDKPSGTAIRTADFIINNLQHKNKYVSDSEAPLKNEINIISKRIGSTVGNHKVFFDSSGDTITIEHNAKSRRGFAEGALLAAKFIKDKKGFYKFEEIFNKFI
jgi:4-hydroxy-tetrahydrodipicolinate reductase